MERVDLNALLGSAGNQAPLELPSALEANPPRLSSSRVTAKRSGRKKYHPRISSIRAKSRFTFSWLAFTSFLNFSKSMPSLISPLP